MYYIVQYLKYVMLEGKLDIVKYSKVTFVKKEKEKRKRKEERKEKKNKKKKEKKSIRLRYGSIIINNISKRIKI